MLLQLTTKLQKTEQKTAPSEKASKEFLFHWKQWTEKLHKEKPYDFFICGHFHFKASTTVSGAEAQAINLGTWVNGDFEPLRLSL